LYFSNKIKLKKPFLYKYFDKKRVRKERLFKDVYLQPDSSLFAEDTFADTINILKNMFEEIDSKTTYKDEDFWHFYDAIEAFLMGERLEDDKGVYFGINNFYDIWEDMCQTYMLNPENRYWQQVLFADKKIIKNDKLDSELYTRKDLGLRPELEINPFKMKINKDFAPRFLKPDLVLLSDENFDIDYKGSIDLYELQIKDYKNLKVVFSENFKENYADVYNIYQKYLQQNTKYRTNPSTDNEWIASFHRDNFISEVNHLLSEFKLINHINRKGIILRNYIIKIIDYKYMRQSDYKEYNSNTFTLNMKGEKENKIKEDIHKQLIYEWTVQQNFENSETTSEFWIPYWNNEELDFEKSKLDITSFASIEFKQSQIKVIKINFKTLQENYVKLSNTL
jgi:hypothetical protein